MPIPATRGDQPPTPNRPQGLPAAPFAIGFLCLLVATAAAAMMSYAHIRGMGVPGCGQGSPCASIASGKWGSIPLGGYRWPVSYLGAAYFSAMLVAWILNNGAMGATLRRLAVVGGVGSAILIGIMLAKETICPWCVAVHIGNFGFIGVMLGARASVQPRAMTGAATLAGVFIIATGGIAAADLTIRENTSREARAQMDDSVAEIRARIQDDAAPAAPAPPGNAATPTAPPPPQPMSPAAPPAVSSPAPAVASQPAAFTGRYRMGPERAGLRVVLFTDFQCPDCKMVEAQIRRVRAERPNVSVSVKHFPFCTACNPHAPNLHANACWAARAAEAAGMMGGAPAFEKMHDWLFEVGGVFTNQQELEAGIRAAGITDVARFVQIMGSDAPLKNIQADIQEALSLGIGTTPFIFVNGVELKGWNAGPTVVYDQLSALAAGDPPALGAENDRPLRAFSKLMTDWREQPAMAWPSRLQAYAMGPITARAKVSVWGDLNEPNTAQVDRIIRDYIAGRQDVRYEFR